MPLNGQMREARSIRETERRQRRSGDPNDRDPSLSVEGMPPNAGQDVVPHVISFSGILRSISRSYVASDEAMMDSWENSRFMRNDTGVMECLEQRQRSTALLDWHLEPEDEKSQIAKSLCEELTTILKRTKYFTKYREALLQALWYGKYGIQHRYRWQKVNGAMRVVVERWRPVNGDKICYRFDDGSGEYDEDQVGILVGPGYSVGQQLSPRWKVERVGKVQPTERGLAYFLEQWERALLAIHTHTVEDGEYEYPRHAGRIHGIGIRSRIYWTWVQQQEALAWLMEFLERSALGYEIWAYPANNPTALAATKKAAQERIGEGRNIVLVPIHPDDRGGQSALVQRIEPAMAGAEVLKGILTDYFGHRIKRYILGQTLTSEAQSTGLGSGVASIHLDTYLQIVKYDAVNLEETITREMVEQLKLFNFPRHADVPVYFRIETESPDIEGRLRAWKDAWEMGLRLPARDVANLIGAETPKEDDEVLESPQTKQLRQQEEAAKQQQAQQQQQQAMDREAAVAQISKALGVQQYRRGLRGKVVARYGKRADLLARAAAETETNPSDEQKVAGNYRKGKVHLWGLEIAIETPKGSTRSGKGWEVPDFPCHYGYIKRTESEADGDHVDVFVGPNLYTDLAFVIDQVTPGGRFDEHKVVLGCTSERKAKALYRSCYTPGWKGLGSITPMTIPQLKAWLESGDTGKPVAQQVSKYRAAKPEHKEGGWKTIGGGARAFVGPTGMIEAGCAGLEGEDLDDLGEDEEPENRRRREHRQDVAEHHGLKGDDLTPAQVKQLEEHPHPETGRDADGEQKAKPSGWDSLPEQGRAGFENHVLKPLRNEVEGLRKVAEFGDRYAWEAAIKGGKKPGDPHAGSQGLARWSEAAKGAGFDPEALVAAHPEYGKLVAELDGYRGWGDEDVTTPPAVTKPADTHPGHLDDSAFLKATDWEKQRKASYFDEQGNKIASSRTTPSTAKVPPVGTWKISDDFNGIYGRDIEQLREMPTDRLILPEGDYTDAGYNPEGRGDDSDRYAQWIREGKEPPPISGSEQEDGRVVIHDGHRRAAAAKKAGVPVKVWVQPYTSTGKLDSAGQPILTPLTREIAQLQAGKLPAETLGHYPDMHALAKQHNHPAADRLKAQPDYRDWNQYQDDEKERWARENVLGWDSMPASKRLQWKVGTDAKASWWAKDNPQPQPVEQPKPAPAAEPPKAAEPPAPEKPVDRTKQWRDMHRQHQEHEWIHLPAARNAVEKAKAAAIAARGRIQQYRDAANTARRAGDSDRAHQYEQAANAIVDEVVTKFDPAVKQAQQALEAAEIARDTLVTQKVNMKAVSGHYNAINFDPGRGQFYQDHELPAFKKAVVAEYRDRKKAEKDSAKESARQQREQQRAERQQAKAAAQQQRQANRGRPRASAEQLQTVASVAQDYGIASDDLLDARDFLLKDAAEYHGEYEAAKKAARKLTGLTGGDMARLENAGYDYTAGRKVGGKTGERLARFDEFAQEIAREYPELGWGDPDSPHGDLGAALWDLIREGKQAGEDPFDEDLLRRAAKLVVENRITAPAREEEEAIPFRKAGMVERYRRWQRGRSLSERFARAFAARGFSVRYSVAWDEAKHPRGQPGNAGEFAKKGGDVKKNDGIAYRPPSKRDLRGDSIHLWHGTSLDLANKIIAAKGLKEGTRGRNATADVEHAMQYPEETGADALVLLRCDPKTLDVDPNDQVGETVADGLFVEHGSSCTVGDHDVAAVFDVSSATGDYVEALQQGDFAKAAKLGVKVLWRPT